MVIGTGPRDFSDTFSEIFVKALDTLASSPEGAFVPVVKDIAAFTTAGGFGAVEVVESDNHIRIFFDVPGTSKSDIKLELVKGQKEYTLKMTATRKPVAINGKPGPRSERFYGTKTRDVALPLDVDPTSMVARHTDGELVVTVKTSKPESVARSIPII